MLSIRCKFPQTMKKQENMLREYKKLNFYNKYNWEGIM